MTEGLDQTFFIYIKKKIKGVKYNFLRFFFFFFLKLLEKVEIRKGDIPTKDKGQREENKSRKSIHVEDKDIVAQPFQRGCFE